MFVESVLGDAASFVAVPAMSDLVSALEPQGTGQAATLALPTPPAILLGGVAGFTTKSAAAEKDLLETREALPLEQRGPAATLALGAIAEQIMAM